nr:glucan endo-1,3-beta-glucosidase 7-like [Ipomoea batatas]
MGFKDVEIVVAETGWAHDGGDKEAGASVENAKAYNGNLIKHLRSMVGTPLMPGKSVDTYIFALYDENMKPGAGSERSFGLFKPDLSPSYDVGLTKSGKTPVSPKAPGAAPVPRRAPGATPATRKSPSAAPVAHTTPPKAAPGTRRAPGAPPVTDGTTAAAPGAPGAPAGNPVTSTTPTSAGNPATPTGQSGSVKSGTAKSCRPPQSLPLVLVIMAAFILVKAHKEEDKLL